MTVRDLKQRFGMNDMKRYLRFFITLFVFPAIAFPLHAQIFGTPEFVRPGVLDAIYYKSSVGANGNNYTVVGSYKNYIYVEAAIISAGGRDITLSHSNGSTQFTVTAGGKYDDEAYDYMYYNNSFYICGYFSDTAKFGATTVVSKGGKDAFVACYNSTGVLSWVRAYGSTGDDWAMSLTNGNPSSNVVVSLNYSGTLVSGPDTLFCSGGSDAAVIVVNSAGATLQIGKLYGGPGDERVNYCTWTSSTAFAVGSFTGAMPWGTNTAISNGGKDFLAASVVPGSGPVWCYTNGGSGDDEAIEFFTNGGNINLAGNFEQSWTGGSTTFTSNGLQDGFFFSVNFTTGTGVGGFSFGGVGNDTVANLSQDQSTTDIVMCGSFENTMILGSDTLVSAGLTDGYIALFTFAGMPLNAKSNGRAGEDVMMYVYYSSGNANYICAGYESQHTVAYPSNYPLEHERAPIARKLSSVNFGFMSGVAHPWSSEAEIQVDRDAQGNYYVTADFTGVVTIDTVEIRSFGNAVLAKFDPAGNLVWLRKSVDIADVGQTSGVSSRGTLIATTALGYTFVAGYFQSKCTFGTTQLTPMHENSNGNCDAFLVCYDPGGSVVFAKRIASSSSQVTLNDLEVNRNNQVLVGGRWGSGLITLEGTNTLTNSSSFNCFLLRYSMIGNLVWTKRIASTSATTFLIDATIDNANCVYAIGSYQGNSQTDLNLTSADQTKHSTFIVKYSSTGQIVWTRQIQSTTTGFQPYGNIVCDSLAGMYIAGPFNYPITLPNGDQYSYNSTSEVDNWIARCDTSGNFIWSFQVANSGSYSNHTHFSLTSNNRGKGMLTYCYGDSLTINGVQYPNHTYIRTGFYTFDLNKNTQSIYEEPEHGIYKLYADRDLSNRILFHGLLAPFYSTIVPDTLFTVPNNASFFVEYLDTCGAAQFNYSETGGNYQFTNMSYGYDSILWNFGDGNYSTSQNPTHMYSTTGTFTVMLVAFTDCGTDTTTALVTWNPLSVPLAVHENISLFPNPTQGNFTVTSSIPMTRIRIFDSQGRSVGDEDTNHTKQYNCNVTDHSSGMLLVEVTLENGEVQLIKLLQAE